MKLGGAHAPGAPLVPTPMTLGVSLTLADISFHEIHTEYT